MAAITVARLYDPGPIQPLVLIDENIGVLMQGDWWFFRVDHIEGIPPSRQTTQNLGAVNNNANSGETEITVARAQDGSVLHIRAAPLDPVEVDFFSGRSTGGRHTTYSTKARVTPWTSNLDPYWSSTTMFVFGNQRSIYANAYNETGYNLGQSRIRFWGYRYRLVPFPAAVSAALRRHLKREELSDGDRTVLRDVRVTLVPAEGRD